MEALRTGGRHATFFFLHEVENTPSLCGRVGNSGFMPLRYIFHGPSYKISYQPYSIDLIHKQTNIIKLVLAVCALIPGLLIGIIPRTLSYLNEDVRKQHQFIMKQKLHLDNIPIGKVERMRLKSETDELEKDAKFFHDLGKPYELIGGPEDKRNSVGSLRDNLKILGIYTDSPAILTQNLWNIYALVLLSTSLTKESFKGVSERFEFISFTHLSEIRRKLLVSPKEGHISVFIQSTEKRASA